MMCREELIWPQTEFHIIYQFLHPPAVVKLGIRIVGLHTTLESAGADHGSYVFQGLHGGFGVEPPLRELVIGFKYLL
jgi:hypothetical protein